MQSHFSQVFRCLIGSSLAVSGNKQVRQNRHCNRIHAHRYQSAEESERWPFQSIVDEVAHKRDERCHRHRDEAGKSYIPCAKPRDAQRLEHHHLQDCPCNNQCQFRCQFPLEQLRRYKIQPAMASVAIAPVTRAETTGFTKTYPVPNAQMVYMPLLM